MRIVLDDEQDAVAGFEIEAVVGQLLDDALLFRRGGLERRRLVVLLRRGGAVPVSGRNISAADTA